MTSKYFSAFCLHPAGDQLFPSRVGFTLPRALGKAVRRNRIKRRMRSAVRGRLASLPESWLIVFNPRRSVLETDFEDLSREVARVFSRCAQS